jgi:hypothetical protein
MMAVTLMYCLYAKLSQRPKRVVAMAINPIATATSMKVVTDAVVKTMLDRSEE